MAGQLLAWFSSHLPWVFGRRPPLPPKSHPPSPVEPLPPEIVTPPPPLAVPPAPPPPPDSGFETELLAAVEEGDLRGVEEALVRGASTDCRNEQGLTPLGLAADLNQERIVEALIRHGVPVNEKEGKSPLLRASEHGHDRIVELLIKAGALVDVQGPEGVTPLIAAAWKGHTEVVRVLVHKGRRKALDTPDDLGRTALMGAVNVQGRNSEMAGILRAAGARVGEAEGDLLQAAARGDLPRLHKLLTAGASPRIADDAGNTPLILAASRGWPEITAELLEHPALDRDARNHEGYTALMEAARAGHDDVVNLLLDEHVKADVRSTRRETALIVAAAAGRASVVKRLLAEAPEIDARDEDGRTALLAACASGSPTAVQCLLEHDPKPDADARASYGNRPLMVAILAGATQVAGLLREAGAGHGEPEAHLFQAARRGEAERVRELIAQGAEVDTQDLEGRTALMEAAEQGFAEVVQALVDGGASVGLTARDRTTTALGPAAHGGWTAVLEILLPRLGPEWERQVSAALLDAIRQGHGETVRFLVERGGADVNARSRSGDTPLTAAVAEGQTDVARILLELGADVDRPGRQRNTPLMTAILEDRHALADLLVEHGAKAGRLEAHLIAAARRGNAPRVQDLLKRLNDEAVAAARDRKGGSVLRAACAGGSVPIVEQLAGRLGANAGPMFEAGDRDGRTPLMAAVQAGHEPVVDLLLGRKVRVDTHGHTGRTALMEAVRSGQKKIVARLLDAKADPNARDQKGSSPLKEALLQRSMAAAEGKEERRRRFDAIVALLETHGGVEGAREARLLEAARNRDLATLKGLLRQRPDSETADLSQRTALMLAAEGGWIEGITALLAAGADVSARDVQRRTPLWLAARNGHIAAVEALLTRKPDPDARAHGERTPVLEAAGQGHAEVVKRLVTAGASPNMADDTGTTPLIEAVRNGHLDVVAFLADRSRSDLDARDQEGRTALTWARLLRHQEIEDVLLRARAGAGLDEAELLLAARQGDGERVSELIGAGVDVRVRDGEGNTALLLAARGGHAEMAGDLLAAGAGPDVRNRKLRTPLLEAAQVGSLEVVRKLLSARASLAARDAARDTALHHAARAGANGVVQELLGAGPGAVNRKGETPLLVAVRGNSGPVVDTLLAAGADPDRGDLDGRTPLMDAAERGYGPILLALLSRSDRNKVNAVDRQGRTAWDLASAQKLDDCRQLLEKHGAKAAGLAGGSVYVTPHGDRYHRHDCGVTKDAKQVDQLQPRSRARALAEGYDPCLLCHPDAEGGADGEEEHPYRKIFASYAHEDEAVVQRFFQHAKALGDDYEIDRQVLRPGEDWEAELRKKIEEADVFQLFWSRHSAGSENVKREWGHALSLGRPGFVRPVYWTARLDPEPPTELAGLHFAQFSLERAPAAKGKGRGVPRA